METKDKITSGAIGILAIAAIVMGANLLEQENVYVCEERQIAMICDSMSKANAEGLLTRCYYFSEEKNRTTYSVCNFGWVKFENPEIKLEYYCNEGDLIRECITDDGTMILRVKNE